MAEPPTRPALDQFHSASTRYGNTGHGSYGSAVAGPQGDDTHSRSRAASIGCNVTQRRANARPFFSPIPHPEFVLGDTEDTPQHKARISRDIELSRIPGYAPHAHGSASEAIETKAYQPCPSNLEGHRTSGPTNHGVHRRELIESQPQPPSPTMTRFLNEGYRDRFGKIHAVSPSLFSSLLSPSAQPQLEQSPLAGTDMLAHGALTSPSPQTSQQGATGSKVARTVEEDTRPARRTNVICRDFTKGLCRNTACPRAHVLDVPPELLISPLQAKQLTPNVQVAATVDPSVLDSNVELCKLNLVGKCPRGPSCKYSHDLGPVVCPSPTSEPAVAGPSGQSGTPDAARTSHAVPEQPLTSSGGTVPLASTNTNPNFIVYPGDVCRKHIHGRCEYSRCRYKHCSQEEIRAFREARRAELMDSAQVDGAQKPPTVSLASPGAKIPGESHSQDDGPVSGNGSKDDESGRDHARPPDSARKRQKKHCASRKSTQEDVQSQSHANKGQEKGGAGKGQEKTKVKDAKAKVMADSEPAMTDAQDDRAERNDKGKSKAKMRKDEKGSVAQASSKKGKAKAEGLTSQKGAPQDTAQQTLTSQRGKSSGSKGKAAQARVEQEEKAPALQAATKEPMRSGSKNGAAKKTVRAQSSVPVAQTQTVQSHPPQAGPSNGQTAANGVDTESEDSEDTFYSARDSRAISAETSLSSVESSSITMVPPKGLCWDHLHGRCFRRYCKFSHDVDAKPLQPGAPGLTSMGLQSSNSFNRTPRDMAQTTTDVSGRTTDPLVPPGLGLENVLDNRRDAQEETVTITIHDSTKVTFSSGFGVVQVITGFESRQIILENIPPTVTPSDITAVLRQTFGEIVAVLAGESTQGGSLVYRVTFAQADAAAEAAASLNSSCLFGVRVTARMSTKKSTGIGGGTLYDGDVLFELPTARKTAFIGYETREQADRAIALANNQEIKGMLVSAVIYQGIPAVGVINVRIEGLPADFTKKDIGRFGKFESYMFDRPKYLSMSGAIQGLRYKLLQHDERVTINVLPPPYRKIFRLWAHFSDEQIAAVACENLHRFCPHFTGKQRIFAHHIKSLRYNLPADIFDVLAYDINMLRSYCTDDKGTSISVIDRRQGASPTAPVLVKLVSQDMPALSKLKAAFDRLLRGEKVTEDGHVVWNDFFGSPAGIHFLADLEKVHPKVRISRDPRRRTLALFGQEAQRARVREDILTRAKLLKAQRKRRYPISGDLIGVFMSEDLFKLQSELGHDNVWFDLAHKELVVQGDEDVQKVAGLAVIHAGQRRQRHASSADAACPVCFGDVSHPITLECGHRWCRACLTSYMHAAVDNKTFPLKCLGDDAKCSHCIPIGLAEKLLSTDEFDAVVHASFLAYVQSRPDEFHYCPTPDCPQVYRKTKRNTVLQCPSCLVRICPHCDTEWHESGSCQDRDPHDELLFDQWKGRHDVKDCPSCKVPIERMAGCNHMTCVSCKAHICWVCLATFPTSQEVYTHMRGIHGGIGL